MFECLGAVPLARWDLSGPVKTGMPMVVSLIARVGGADLYVCYCHYSRIRGWP